MCRRARRQQQWTSSMRTTRKTVTFDRNLNKHSLSLIIYQPSLPVTIMLQLTVRVFHSAETFQIEIDENSPVEKLMKMIFQHTRVPLIEQCLVSRGKKLEEDFNLNDYILLSGNIVHLLVRPQEILKIVVLFPDIKKFKLSLSSKTQVEDFRDLITKKLPSSTPNSFRIRHKGFVLENGKTLGDYNMKHKCKVIVDWNSN